MSGRGSQIGKRGKEEEYVAYSHISGQRQMKSLTWVQLQSPMPVITLGHCLCKAFSGNTPQFASLPERRRGRRDFHTQIWLRSRTHGVAALGHVYVAGQTG